MSTYVREKVLRIPFYKLSKTFFDNNSDLVNEYGEPGAYEAPRKYPSVFRYGEPGFFQIAPTEENFLDYVLEADTDTCSEWGRSRILYENEKNKYRSIFQKIAPDYYDDDPEKDSFYDEV